MNKKMNNIKMVPTYACKLGKGMFAGPRWQCRKCGKTCSGNYKPPPEAFGKCPSTASGNHMWVQI